MATHELATINISEKLSSQVVTLRSFNDEIIAYSQGSTNSIKHRGFPVTAIRPLDIMIVNFDRVDIQRGGNPIVDPAGLYNNQSIVQPGKKDIHGVFTGMPWEITNTDENGTIEMKLTARVWKQILKDYYKLGAKKEREYYDNRESLNRLLFAAFNEYRGDGKEMPDLLILEEYLNSILDSQTNSKIDKIIEHLVDIIFLGDPDLVRRITIEHIAENATSYYDELTITNTSQDESYKDAAGYHTYFHALLSQIVVSPDFWPNGIIPDYYDENLPDVQIREINQLNTKYNRRIFLVPEGEFRTRKSHQILYKDEFTIGEEEAAMEVWRQPGNPNFFPKKSRIIKPGKTSIVGIRIIVVDGERIPEVVLDYFREVNTDLSKFSEQ